MTYANPPLAIVTACTLAVFMFLGVCSLHAQIWSAPVLVENGGGAAVSSTANGTEAVIYAGLAAVKTGGVWRTPVLLGSGSPASDSGASGDAAYTLLPEASTWNKTSFSTVYNVAAAGRNSGIPRRNVKQL